MKASELQARSVNPFLEHTSSHAHTPSPESPVTFGDTLKTFIADVNTLQNEAGKAVQDFSSGDGTEVHDVMIAAEKARTSFDLLVEIRNKTIDAYRELMRLPV